MSAGTGAEAAAAQCQGRTLEVTYLSHSSQVIMANQRPSYQYDQSEDTEAVSSHGEDAEGGDGRGQGEQPASVVD